MSAVGGWTGCAGRCRGLRGPEMQGRRGGHELCLGRIRGGRRAVPRGVGHGAAHGWARLRRCRRRCRSRFGRPCEGRCARRRSAGQLWRTCWRQREKPGARRSKSTLQRLRAWVQATQVRPPSASSQGGAVDVLHLHGGGGGADAMLGGHAPHLQRVPGQLGRDPNGEPLGLHGGWSRGVQGGDGAGVPGRVPTRGCGGGTCAVAGLGSVPGLSGAGVTRRCCRKYQQTHA